MTPLRQRRSHLFSFYKCLMTEVKFLPLAKGDNVMLERIENGVKVNEHNIISIKIWFKLEIVFLAGMHNLF